MDRGYINILFQQQELVAQKCQIMFLNAICMCNIYAYTYIHIYIYVSVKICLLKQSLNLNSRAYFELSTYKLLILLLFSC